MRPCLTGVNFNILHQFTAQTCESVNRVLIHFAVRNVRQPIIKERESTKEVAKKAIFTGKLMRRKDGGGFCTSSLGCGEVFLVVLVLGGRSQCDHQEIVNHSFALQANASE